MHTYAIREPRGCLVLAHNSLSQDLYLVLYDALEQEELLDHFLTPVPGSDGLYEVSDTQFLEEGYGEERPWVLHATNHPRGEPIRALNWAVLAQGALFQSNVVYFDMGMSTFCLALRREGAALRLRAGWHHWYGGGGYDGPIDWETLPGLNARSYESVVPEGPFRDAYDRALALWRQTPFFCERCAP